jgi:hypothetical protein
LAAAASGRWARGLDPRISKDQWSAEDEERIIALVAEKGSRGWTSIASTARP